MKDENPDLQKPVEKDTELKEWLVRHVGLKIDREKVTVEDIIEVMAKEFPEFLLCIAEENFIRGYQQAFDDIETGKQLVQKKANA